MNTLKLRFSAWLVIFSVPIFSEIKVDGILDDPEWNDASQITKFYEVFPYSLNEVTDFKTVILIQESEKGIYLGYKNYQSNESMRSQNHERDNERSMADKNGVTIDFDADGLTGYQFFVSSGGSIGDATYRNENNKNTDWDADWLSATTIGDGVWYSEVFIPWSVAPMKAQSGPNRKVKLGFYRMMAGYSRVFATIQGSPYQNIYLSAFNDFTFTNYQSSKIDYFPYLTLNEDRLEGEVDNKIGAEIFWKIDSSRQLNAAFNPDFGQVESDDVVVNFSASETFYSDKRPFFSENHNLFNVQGSRFFYVINTRRIGASPDYNCSEDFPLQQELCEDSQKGANDIDAAFRYTQQGENFDAGFLGAFETNEKFSEGKDFYAVRLRTKRDNLTVGYLGTYVNRPVIDRTAKVNAMDFEYRPSSIRRLSGTALASDANGKTGYGFNLGYGHDPSKNRHNGVGVFYVDEDLDLKDMGYLWRNNLLMISGRASIKQTDFSQDSIARARKYEIAYSLKSTSDFEKEPSGFSFSAENSFTNTSEIKAEVFYRTTGRDNLITRKSALSPFINMPKGYGVEFEYRGPSDDFLQYGFEVDRRQGSRYSAALGWQTSYQGKVSISPADTLSLSLFYKHGQEEDWLNWLQDNVLGTYQKKQRTTIVGLQWFKGNKHELRIKAQMVAFTARDPQAYLADLYGNLNPSSNINLLPITLSELAFQVRYRYELMPLAYLYVVYTKGGRIVADDTEDDLSELYKRPWNDPQSDNFTVKLRYRF
tara:strand:+ start:262 stop:2553 length:2292 start_codon:yes stop_codon:yes gene_type:complete